MPAFPYTDQFGIHDRLPEAGTPREVVLEQLAAMAQAEDPTWETGKCSGTMYCGDHEHYDFINQAFSRFSHVNALQRDMCPSATKFESEIIAMTLDLLGAPRGGDAQPVGLVTTGGTNSIVHAVLAYREHAASRTRTPNLIKPETAHPAFDKACHLFGVELRHRTGRPGHDPGRRRLGAPSTSTMTPSRSIGSACNYGYGTIDPIEELGELAIEHGIGLHVDGCLGGFILPFARELGYDLAPRSTCRSPA
jgi:sphinganine-1-phosphate aldolase